MTEQEMKEAFEKLWIDSTYALSTHFEMLVSRIDKLERQVVIQNKVIKELWAFKKASEGK